MTPNLDVPAGVAQASRVNFGRAITAYLHQPAMEGFSLIGRVYFDRKDRFKSGRLIRTSDVVEFIEIADHLVAITRTDSAYVLIDPQCQLLSAPLE
ncbi:hypothetical protein SAMN05444064_13148 [Pseudomonas syringae]|uniref:hypothetical protein n=1 Tax=Pseudomonas TaxID=286 RepID=UPI00089A071C|nr:MULTISPECIES: hypothetical protein [Pseudomonas]PBP93262.1 hypothetical protein CCL24_25705 [Pseudomonas congelans]SDX68413.1 hypothetical protein SAMN05444514_13248 [Pseudomonas syringae]SFM76118.1 hypothetical protein SAMN05444064_13148 [Pseudomonas syringae]